MLKWSLAQFYKGSFVYEILVIIHRLENNIQVILIYDYSREIINFNIFYFTPVLHVPSLYYMAGEGCPM